MIHDLDMYYYKYTEQFSVKVIFLRPDLNEIGRGGGPLDPNDRKNT